MSPLNISEEEKERIRKQHEDAVKKFHQKMESDKAGLKAPEKKEEESKK